MPRKKQARSIYVTKEPDWKALRLVEGIEEQKKAFDSCDYFARTEISSKKKVEAAKKWIKEESGWTKDEIKMILANPDWAFSSSSAYFIYYKIGYMPESTYNHIHKRKDEWLVRGKECLKEQLAKAEEKKSKPVVSIQDRMKEQCTPLMAEWEHYIDQLVDGDFDVKSFDPYNEMRAYSIASIKPAHAKVIKEEFDAQYREALEVLEWTDEDIKEAYQNFTPKMRKEFVALYEKINTACDTMIQTGKATRKPRKPKAVSKEKMVAKLKYQVNDPALGIASIDPTEVAHANELWVYNTKTRKLGIYHALNKDPRNMGRDGLTVKGTTVQAFDEEASVQKTLRKPAEQLQNFKGNAKTKYQKAFDEIKTTDTKLNGRFNDNTIILKAF